MFLLLLNIIWTDYESIRSGLVIELMPRVVQYPLTVWIFVMFNITVLLILGALHHLILVIAIAKCQRGKQELEEDRTELCKCWELAL